MLTIGLTGNIGSGKTTVTGIFQALQIPVFNADRESKALLMEPKMLQMVGNLFGDQVFSADGTLNKSALANLVFEDAQALEKLNNLLHPGVIRRFMEWKISQPAPYTIMESAIIFETGIRNIFDKVIHVSCPKEIAINRVIERDQVDGDAILRRMNFQMSDEDKKAATDFIIHNSGQQLLIPQVLHIHRTLLETGTNGHDDIPSGIANP